jgi:long-subunit acyl-CoA synthetase (AMP-forming)
VPNRRRIAESLNRDIAALTAAEIEAALWEQIDRVNSRLENYERVKKICVIGAEFPPEVRSINQFQKVKVDRSLVARWYQNEIEAIYGGEN